MRREVNSSDFRKDMGSYLLKAESEVIHIKRRYRPGVVILSENLYETLIRHNGRPEPQGAAIEAIGVSYQHKLGSAASEALCANNDSPEPQRWLVNKFMSIELCVKFTVTDSGGLCSLGSAFPSENSLPRARAQYCIYNLYNNTKLRYIEDRRLVGGEAQESDPPTYPPFLRAEKKSVKEKMKNNVIISEVDAKIQHSNLQAEEIRALFFGQQLYNACDISILSIFLNERKFTFEDVLASRKEMQSKGFVPRYWRSVVPWFESYLKKKNTSSASAQDPLALLRGALDPAGCLDGDIRKGHSGREYVFISNKNKRWLEIHMEAHGNKKGDKYLDPRRTEYTFIRKDKYVEISKKLRL